MSRFKTVLLTILVLLVIIILIGGFYARHIATRGLPDYDGEMTLNNLQESVRVVRDELGIPHIYATNEEDLYRATGVCMAQDRLWQIDLIRRATQGRLSEIFGADFVDVDLLLRALRIPEKSRMILNQSDSKLRASLVAFSDGVNQYIQSRGKDLPPEFAILGYEPDPWKPEHSLNLIGYMAWDLTMPWSIELTLHQLRDKVSNDMFADLIPDMRYQPDVVYEDMPSLGSLSVDQTLLSANEKLRSLGIDIFSGSNNWVIGGQRSATGMPIFANDMHLGFNIPGIWYQMHQVIEGELNVTGVALPGAPAVIAGHNDNIAWGMTNVMVDDMDFFLEKINPEDSTQYWYKGRWHDMEIRTEDIITSDGDTVSKKLRFTRHGPIISTFKGLENLTVSMKWIGNEPSNELRSVYWLNRARNWSEFTEAITSFISVSQNIAYADIDGNIGIYCCAGVPIRKNGDGSTVVPGWTDEYEWTGLVPYDQLPHEFNPDRGYVSSANNRSVNANSPTQIPQWPAPHYRISRIRELIESFEDPVTIDDIKTMHTDVHSRMIDDLKPRIMTALNALENPDDALIAARTILEKWDGWYDKNSPAPFIYEEMYGHMLHNLFEDEMGEELVKQYINVGYMAQFAVINLWHNPESHWCDNIETPDKTESLDDIIRLSFRDAVTGLQETQGNDPTQWRWGDVHTLTLEHPLGSVAVLDKLFGFNRGPYPVDGSSHTVGPYMYSYNAPYSVYHGASHRHIFSTDNWETSQTIIPTGISGIPASDYYCNQTDMYLNGIYHDDGVTKEFVNRHKTAEMILIPSDD